MKTLYAILIATATCAATAMAQPGYGEGKRHDGDDSKQRPNREQLAKKLDLTPEQQKALQEAREEMQVQMIDLRAAAQKARLMTRSQMNKDEINRDEVMKAIEAESAAELAIRKAMADHHLKVREIVGPEKARQMKEMFENRGEGGMGMGPGGPGGRGHGGDDGDDDNNDSDRGPGNN